MNAGKRVVRPWHRALWLTGIGIVVSQPAHAHAQDGRSGLGPAELGVIVNEADALSRAIADYYVKRRGIPARNVVRVQFEATNDVLAQAEFTRIKQDIDRRLPATVQALALTWARPYRVDCMSITSAFAFGFDASACAAGCQPTAMSRYYDSDSPAPQRDYGIRPAMSLAAVNLEQARALIDRGIEADRGHRGGTAYLLDTNDHARNARAGGYFAAREFAADRVRVQVVRADYLENKRDVLLYETGVSQVRKLDSNQFVPGAIGDHLTSFGGNLFGTSQMSSLRWLEAGATASYGTVVEPCAFTAKFPNPAVLLKHYVAGETLIEAYWKSVAMPGQGLFIGEPLARPFGTAQ
ncbi:MAG TPA: TIGR03790 family protein [Steroidobacteraceae bacterium]|nr:TIGR03790 family protein [Steroidobacteraceae bacterium]